MKDLSTVVSHFEQTLDVIVLCCAIPTLLYILIGAKLEVKRTQVQSLIVWLLILIILSNFGNFFLQHFVKNINDSVQILANIVFAALAGCL